MKQKKILEQIKNIFGLKLLILALKKIFSKKKKEKMVIGSSYCIAPEVLNKQYNEKCDNWSIGVVLFMLIIGLPPFDGENNDKIIKSIQKGEYDKNNEKLIKCLNEV